MSDVNQVKQLRETTGAGMVDCQKALEESGGDMEKAVDVLRKKGLEKAGKKAERKTGEGLIYAYIHPNNRVGTLVQVSCETDFVARTDEFKELVKDIAMQVAGAAPKYLAPEDVPAEELEKEKEIYREQLKNEGKPAEMIEKILEGKLQKYYADVCLLKQPFIKEDKITIEQLIAEKIGKIGENIKVARFTRYDM